MDIKWHRYARTPGLLVGDFPDAAGHPASVTITEGVTPPTLRLIGPGHQPPVLGQAQAAALVPIFVEFAATGQYTPPAQEQP